MKVTAVLMSVFLLLGQCVSVSANSNITIINNCDGVSSSTASIYAEQVINNIEDI